MSPAGPSLLLEGAPESYMSCESDGCHCGSSATSPSGFGWHGSMALCDDGCLARAVEAGFARMRGPVRGSKLSIVRSR